VIRKIKRILWVEDNQDITRAANLFPDVETKKVSTMDEAIKEIAGPHLYDYDTIVLDIDFENGLPNGAEFVVEELSKKLYLDKSQDQHTNKFLMDNGGYLLCLYLLEKGYPSDQIAFLTGNPGIIEFLQRYTLENINQLSKDEIIELIEETWDNIWDGNDSSIEVFTDAVDQLPIRSEYKIDSVSYAEALYCEDREELEKLITSVEVKTPTKSIKNTGDIMIYRFHGANLEPPRYFSKNDNDIEGHNYIDAKEWLLKQRTENRLTRWLTLEATNYIEQLFKDDSSMNRQVAFLFNGSRNDPGIRSAFRQMFFVFDGLRATERRGAYYQALSAMLVPFDSTPKNRRPIIETPNDYDNLRWTFAWFSKEARNYSSHNLFGSSVSNNTVLFILLGTMIAVLDKDQIAAFQYWIDIIKNEFFVNECEVDLAEAIGKVDNYVGKLSSEGHISVDNPKIKKLPQNLIDKENLRESQPYGVVKLLGVNSEMTVKSEQSSSKREEYYIFCLASYITKSFEGIEYSTIKEVYGDAVSSFVEIASSIVEKYSYPKFSE